jgi:hypothetical protein
LLSLTNSYKVASHGTHRTPALDCANFLAAHHTASVKAVLHKAVRDFIDADLAKNQGVREDFEALRRARRERNGTNVHLIKSDKAC